jgi:hypothetical protein
MPAMMSLVGRYVRDEPVAMENLARVSMPRAFIGSTLSRATKLSYFWSLDHVLIIIYPVLLGLISLVGPSSGILVIPRPGDLHIIRDANQYSYKSNKDLFTLYLINLTA